MTPRDYLVEGLLLSLGAGLVLVTAARKYAREIRLRRFLRNSKRIVIEASTGIDDQWLGRFRRDVPADDIRDVADVVWRARRDHTYECASCGARVVGLDYCIPHGWHPGALLDSPTAARYACSAACRNALMKKEASA